VSVRARARHAAGRSSATEPETCDRHVTRAELEAALGELLERPAVELAALAAEYLLTRRDPGHEAPGLH
jgi:hypothetical protein